MTVNLTAQLTPNVEQILNDVTLTNVHAALISGDTVTFQTMSRYQPSKRLEEPRGLPEGGRREMTVTFTAEVENHRVQVMAINRDVFRDQNLFTAVVRWEGGLRGARWTWRHVEFHDGRAAWWKTHDPNQASMNPWRRSATPRPSTRRSRRPSWLHHCPLAGTSSR